MPLCVPTTPARGLAAVRRPRAQRRGHALIKIIYNVIKININYFCIFADKILVNIDGVTLVTNRKLCDY
ncbi:MAG TPA: hypothetical protein PLZ46_04250 [Bacteroidales bacterium]|nr:hypothetical protein [Bacteroidales bacterium]